MMNALSVTLSNALEQWHQFAATGNKAILQSLLTDDCVFHSPFLWKPKPGKDKTMMALTAASQIFENFAYHRQLTDGTSVMLEFSANVGEMSLKGIDLIRFNADGRIEDFEVMIRPFKGLQALAEAMTKQLMKQGDYEAFIAG
ncbi:MAG TPA: nuclear transport factor 2 family protein [Blastocatellia bacterium]|nr:nuclear transport factor 2 family protein [Blastocatellia bacterium]